ncbi:ATP-binding protein [Nonomuraea sp. NPDC050310]|uniref:ATP-binding protein n=1 Tax=Nonomuraea sp. NPDC050310 TaxID=3154935 RepID=UPI0033F52128
MHDLDALAALRLHPVEVADDVWRPSPFHVDDLYPNIERVLRAALTETRTDGNPVGLAVRGIRGTGKTHLLGWLREQVMRDGGYFFLFSLLDAKGFWESAVVSMLDGLARPGPEGQTQLRVLLSRLAHEVNLPRMKRREAAGRSPLSRETLDLFVEEVRRRHPKAGRECRDVLRALVLLAGPDLGLQDIGEAYLTCVPEGHPGERAHWGLGPAVPSPQEIVRHLSLVLSLTGHSVIAVDQVDTLIAQSGLNTAGEETISWNDKLVVERVGGGLMTLRESTFRTLTVLSCLPASWAMIKKVATDSVQDRFREVPLLHTTLHRDLAQNLVERRFTGRFAEIGFAPPYPTWPVLPAFFDRVTDFTPRELLLEIDRHVQACLAEGVVRGLDGSGRVPVTPVAPAPGDHDELDARFAALLARGDLGLRLDADSEDEVIPPLLDAGLSAWIMEQGEAGRRYSRDAAPSSRPPLHARLREVLDDATGDEIHWAFRAIGAKHHNAVLARLRAASVAAGLDAATPKRRLFVLRNSAWPSGPITRLTVEAFEEAGGRVLPLASDDLHLLAALRDLLAANPPGLPTWLATRRPTQGLKLLTTTLTPPPAPTPTVFGSHPTPAPTVLLGHPSQNGQSAGPTTPAGTAGHPQIPLGHDTTNETPLHLDLEALRKHVAVFAGSGSGKTVLIRRLIEECALKGVSAIVLDPNNDLARLGDPWPDPHPEPTRAEAYLANTEVVIWTPRRDSGRPLAFHPLPDFTAVADDPDEYDQAVESALAALIPHARLTARTVKAHRGQAVLREALDWYGKRSRTARPDLKGLIALLGDLPDGVSRLDNAHRIAADLGESLKAAMVIDPLFGGAGEPADPGVLLTPAPGRRARVSVISFVGLQADDQRQSFVNQLQMALFAWIKKHPAGDRPLGGLFVMDEAQTFAPSGALTPCTQSTLALASQARKYGLGLVFATQAPRGLHNRIPGNCATQFFGLLNAPAQIAAARELAAAKGSAVEDIARLRTGQFYASAEGDPFVKIQTPLCLSHHPRAPLSTEEVLLRARSTT